MTGLVLSAVTRAFDHPVPRTVLGGVDLTIAQGEFVMLAGFLMAGMLVLAGAPFWLGAVVAVAGMVAFGFGLERVVLRPLIGRRPCGSVYPNAPYKRP